MDSVEPSIRLATPADFPAIWRIFRTVLEEGETYDFSGEEEDARRFWYPTDGQTYVAELGRVVAAAFIKQDGNDPKTANAAFIVETAHRGRGIGEKLARLALEEALALGYSAMQFNFVISTNTRALRLWQRLGFTIVDRRVNAFEHPGAGAVDALVMRCDLNR